MSSWSCRLVCGDRRILSVSLCHCEGSWSETIPGKKCTLRFLQVGALYSSVNLRHHAKHGVGHARGKEQRYILNVCEEYLFPVPKS